jgi:hypothetical protein
MADLEVVLKKEHLLVLTLSVVPTRTTTESRPTTALSSGTSGSVQSLQCNTQLQRERKQSARDGGPGGGAEEGALVGLDFVVPLAPLHESPRTEPQHTHSTPTALL